MATTTNYGWTTPDDTALVKDGAAAIRTLGSSVDTTTKNLNPETTLGDIAYRSSTANVNTRLALGTANQVLRVNSGATAPEWANPAAASTTYTLLNSGGTTLSGVSTVTVNVTTKENYYIVIISGSTTGQADIDLRINGDSGTNYITPRGTVENQTSYSTAVVQSLGSTTSTAIRLTGTSNNGASVFNAGIYVAAGNSTTLHPFQSHGSASSGGGNEHRFMSTVGVYSGSAAITSFTVLTAGTFDAGTIYIYGG